MSKPEKDLEQEFEAAVKEINTKLELAAQYIKEARVIGANHGMEYLGGSYIREDLSEEILEKMDQIDFDPVLNQLDAAGWSTSSLHC